MDANVDLALRGLLSLEQLDGDQQEEYFDRLGDMLWSGPSAAESLFFAERRQRGVGVGMDEDGQIVFQGKSNPSS